MQSARELEKAAQRRGLELRHRAHQPPTCSTFVFYIPVFIDLLETGSRYVAQAGLKFLILLPQPPECWDFRHAPPGPASLCHIFRLRLLFYVLSLDQSHLV
jgi:hypothetical protein